MKILELTDFSTGACGVWHRARCESILLSKNHEVMIMSSDAVRDSPKKVPFNDKAENVRIRRFSFWNPAGKGEFFMFWDFEEQALKFKPDVIIAHAYRQPHTIKALKIARKIGAKVFLVPHAPFIEKNVTRSVLARIFVELYDILIAPFIINRFDKVIAIAKWEIPYLLKLGLKKEKLVYIPNGIPDEFFRQKKQKPLNKILFLGRVTPIKYLEILTAAFKLIKNKQTILEIVGPSNKKYMDDLKALIKEEGLEKRIKFTLPIYNLKKKIKKIDSAEIFVLPSRREAMPQVLIEAMARGKLVISSDTQGGKEIIKDGKNGFIFKTGDVKQLAELIDKIPKMKKEEIYKIKKQAIKSAEVFKWSKLIKKLNLG